MAVGWVVVRSLAGFLDAGPSGDDYLGGRCLPSLGRLVPEACRYVDNHALPLCGLEHIGGGDLLMSDGDGRRTTESTEHEGRRARRKSRSD